MVKEDDFMIVKLSDNRSGVLKTVGKRGIVISCEFIEGADEADNTWIMEQAKQLYEAYYKRVSEYRRGC